MYAQVDILDVLANYINRDFAQVNLAYHQSSYQLCVKSDLIGMNQRRKRVSTGSGSDRVFSAQLKACSDDIGLPLFDLDPVATAPGTDSIGILSMLLKRNY